MHLYVADNFKPEVILRNSVMCSWSLRNASQERNLLIVVFLISVEGQKNCVFTCDIAFLLDRVETYLQSTNVIFT